MKTPNFTSVFAQDLKRFLQFKQNMGCYGPSRIYYLRSFDEYCTAHLARLLDQKTVEGCIEVSVHPSQAHHRRGCRRFATLAVECALIQIPKSTFLRINGVQVSKDHKSVCSVSQRLRVSVWQPNT